MSKYTEQSNDIVFLSPWPVYWWVWDEISNFYMEDVIMCCLLLPVTVSSSRGGWVWNNDGMMNRRGKLNKFRNQVFLMPLHTPWISHKVTQVRTQASAVSFGLVFTKRIDNHGRNLKELHVHNKIENATHASKDMP